MVMIIINSIVSIGAMILSFVYYFTKKNEGDILSAIFWAIISLINIIVLSMNV